MDFFGPRRHRGGFWMVDFGFVWIFLARAGTGVDFGFGGWVFAGRFFLCLALYQGPIGKGRGKEHGHNPPTHTTIKRNYYNFFYSCMGGWIMVSPKNVVFRRKTVFSPLHLSPVRSPRFLKKILSKNPISPFRIFFFKTS